MNNGLLRITSLTTLEANVASKAIYIASSWGLNAYHCSFIIKNVSTISFQTKGVGREKPHATITRYCRGVGKNTPFREHNIISFYSKPVGVQLTSDSYA